MRGLLPRPADDRTRRAMLRLFFEQSGVSLVAAALLVLLQLGYAAGSVATAGLAAWALAFVVLLGVRAHWRRSVLALDDTALAASVARWERRADIGSGLTGLLWAAALAMVFDAGRGATQMYCAMLACITCVASINVMAPLPRAFLMLLAPVAATLTALFLGLGRWAGLYDALLALAGSALATSLLLRHTRLLHESHAMRFEREALLAETQAAREAQARFLAAASHDLRQPVHALGLLAAQAQAELGGRRAAGTAASLPAMAQALDSLVETLLDVSRLDSGAVVPHPRALPLAPLFDRLAPEFAVLAEARGLQWRLRPTALWVRSDEQQLERMLRNLLSNALTRTQRGGVLLAARLRGGGGRISVWDTGPGIAPDQHQRIFQEFVQLDNPGRDRRRGHGLGLSIVARLSRLLQHPVELRSHPGRGSCGSLLLPPAASTCCCRGPSRWRTTRRCARRRSTCRGPGAARSGPMPPWRRCWHSCRGPACGLIGRSATGGSARATAWPRSRRCAPAPALLDSGEPLPLATLRPDERRITPARKPLPAAALRAWLSAPAP